MTTPYTPATPDIARDAADRLLTEQWPVMSMFMTTQACIAAREKFVRDIIQQAIERDRAERDAEMNALGEAAMCNADAAKMAEMHLAERHAELTRAQSAELLALRAALIKYSEWFGPCLGTYPEEGEKNEAWDAEAQGIDDQVAAALNSPTQKSPAK